MFFKFEPDLQPSVQVKLEGAKAEETQNFVKNVVLTSRTWCLVYKKANTKCLKI